MADRRSTEFLIIGAGFTGLSAALRLGELQRETGQAARVLLIDAGGIASGPSGKSAGHVCGLQASDARVRRRCGASLGGALIAAAHDAQGLVRSLIERYGVACDLRDGYTLIDRHGRQTSYPGGAEFGIDGLAFAGGIAAAARSFGVEIVEGVRAAGLEGSAGGYRVATSAGEIAASQVLASGGHRMAFDIPALRALRRLTTELKVSTIISEPVPGSVLQRTMAGPPGRPFPFSNTETNVAYGWVRPDRRVIFGACATAMRDPDPRRIISVAHRVLPELRREFRLETGRDLGWQTHLAAERLCFTRDFLPNVGVLSAYPGVLYAHAFGGHGIALGTLLGRSAADKMWGRQFGLEVADAAFDSFAAIPHRRLLSMPPLRRLAALAGLLARAVVDAA